MKSKYISGLLISASIAMTSCSDFTDIDAKGNNLLATVNDLEQLLNPEYGYDYTTGVDLGGVDMKELCGDQFYSYSLFSNSIMVPVKTAKSIRWTWDEDGWINNLPELTTSDSFYTSCYYYIGRIANPILAQIDDATGDASKKNAIRAEAYTIRAYFHYLAIQKFAPAYNPSTAANTIGLCYITEDMNIKTPVPPISLEEYYTKILDDIQTAIDLDALPENAINRMRFNRATPYAIKALALMSMQKYGEAAISAQQALDIDDTVVNYNESMSTTMIRKTDQSPLEEHKVFIRPRLAFNEDYFTMYGLIMNECITPYAQSFIEPGHVFNYYLNSVSLGKDVEERDKDCMKRIGEKGYIIASDDLSNWYPPCGLRSTQMYLILAEAAIHDSRINDAMGYLDKIRINRIVPEEYADLQGVVTDKATAIKYLKMSAQTEGMFSIWNFVNRKRWTQIEDFKETITRTVCGIDMTLTPDSKLWVFPIPQNVININPNFKPFLND